MDIPPLPTEMKFQRRTIPVFRGALKFIHLKAMCAGSWGFRITWIAALKRLNAPGGDVSGSRTVHFIHGIRENAVQEWRWFILENIYSDTVFGEIACVIDMLMPALFPLTGIFVFICIVSIFVSHIFLMLSIGCKINKSCIPADLIDFVFNFIKLYFLLLLVIIMSIFLSFIGYVIVMEIYELWNNM